MASLDRRMGTEPDAESGSLVEMLVHDEAGPVQNLESAENRQAVLQAIERLPEQLRQVVLLVYYQGLKYREAAGVLSIPVGTVKSRLHAAMQKLNEVLSKIHDPQ